MTTASAPVPPPGPLTGIPTPELLVVFWPEAFEVSLPDGDAKYYELAITALVAAAVDLRDHGFVSFNQVTKKGMFGKEKTRAEALFDQAPVGLTGEAGRIFKHSKSGQRLSSFVVNSAVSGVTATFMARTWATGHERGFYTVETTGKGLRSHKVYHLITTARDTTREAGQELARRYLAFRDGEPGMYAELRKGAESALPLVRDTGADSTLTFT